ncbi:MAG: DUF6339 family protein [Chloroflexi bacterium]|nr:DUF6339 family protein [Chloroflexota bacterium]
MANSFPVLRLTQEAYDTLRQEAENNPDTWLDPQADFDALLNNRGVTQPTEETGVFSDHPISLRPVADGPPNRADRQALDFYNSLFGMTPNTATDERIWAWMTHFRLHSYGLQRWRRQKNTKLTNYIRDHWFVSTQSSALWESNTASRTWWIAYTAVKAAEASGGAFTAQEALDDFAEYAGHYHRLMDYNFTRHPLVLAEIVRALLKEAQGIQADKGVYALTRRLNLLAGTQLLDTLPRELLRKHIVEHVEEVMTDPELVSDRTKLRNRKPFRSLSLGAGVQSTVLALMAERGEYGLPRPDVAIFADTGWEPPAVYEHLEWLKSQLSFEVITVRSGNIKDNILNGTSPDGNNYLGIPAFLVNPDGSSAIARRQCTSKYKIKPINRYLRERLQIPPNRRAPKNVQVELWMGISADEALRQKPSREEWATNRFPLVELGFSRAQLLNWFKQNYPDRYLPRSSCIGCPYHSNAEWKLLKENDPDSFQEAVFVDRALREVPVVRNAITKKGQAYLHRSRKPLSDIDFSTTEDYDNLMVQECEGLCGI